MFAEPRPARAGLKRMHALRGAFRSLSSSASKSAALERLSSVLGCTLTDLQTEAHLDLRKSKLAGSELNADQIGLVAELIADNPNVLSVDISANGFGADGSAGLGHLVRSCASLQHLASGQNNMRNGVAELAAAVAESPTLQRLDVPANAVSAGACTAAAAALAANGALLELNISWNPFGPVGGAAFAELLATSRALQSLNLAGCGIARLGTVAVAEALGAATETSLRHLDLSENFVGREGAEALAAMLRRNSVLQSLELGANGPLDRAAVEALAAAIEANGSLLSLGLQNNGLDETSKAVLRRAKEASDGRRAAPLQLVL